MKNYLTAFVFTLSIGTIVLSAGCYKDNKESMYPSVGCDTTNITWNKDIKGIVSKSCAISGCHDVTASGGYNLGAYTGVKNMVDNNRFIAVLEAGSMPKNASKLDNCTINKVRRWINTGALEN